MLEVLSIPSAPIKLKVGLETRLETSLRYKCQVELLLKKRGGATAAQELAGPDLLKENAPRLNLFG